LRFADSTSFSLQFVNVRKKKAEEKISIYINPQT
jgi:hypothetical protein